MPVCSACCSTTGGGPGPCIPTPPPRTHAQHLPPAQPQEDSRDHLARWQQGCPGPGRNIRHVLLCCHEGARTALAMSAEGRTDGFPRIRYTNWQLGSKPAGRPVLRYKDVSKRDMKAGNIDPAGWEAAALNHSRLKLAIKEHQDR